MAMTRDLNTLDEDGPDVTSFESPSARDTGTESALRPRPSYSPVAQPGIDGSVWYHTVSSAGHPGHARIPTSGVAPRIETVQPAREPKRRRRRGK